MDDGIGDKLSVLEATLEDALKERPNIVELRDVVPEIALRFLRARFFWLEDYKKEVKTVESLQSPQSFYENSFYCNIRTSPPWRPKIFVEDDHSKLLSRLLTDKDATDVAWDSIKKILPNCVDFDDKHRLQCVDLANFLPWGSDSHDFDRIFLCLRSSWTDCSFDPHPVTKWDDRKRGVYGDRVLDFANYEKKLRITRGVRFEEDGDVLQECTVKYGNPDGDTVVLELKSRVQLQDYLVRSVDRGNVVVAISNDTRMKLIVRDKNANVDLGGVIVGLDRVNSWHLTGAFVPKDLKLVTKNDTELVLVIWYQLWDVQNRYFQSGTDYVVILHLEFVGDTVRSKDVKATRLRNITCLATNHGLSLEESLFCVGTTSGMVHVFELKTRDQGKCIYWKESLVGQIGIPVEKIKFVDPKRLALLVSSNTESVLIRCLKTVKMEGVSFASIFRREHRPQDVDLGLGNVLDFDVDRGIMAVLTPRGKFLFLDCNGFKIAADVALLTQDQASCLGYYLKRRRYQRGPFDSVTFDLMGERASVNLPNGDLIMVQKPSAKQ